MKRKLFVYSVLLSLAAFPLAAQESQGQVMESPKAVQLESSGSGFQNGDAVRKAKEEKLDLVRRISGYSFLAVLVGWMFWPRKKKTSGEEMEEDVDEKEEGSPSDGEDNSRA